MPTVAVQLLLRWVLAPLAAIGILYALYAYIGHLQARAEAAELRATTAETRAELTAAVTTIEVIHEVAIASLPAVPVYASGLRRVCEQSAVRPSAPAGDNQAQGDAQAGVSEIEAIANDVRACEVDDERHNAAVELLDLIYNANSR